MEVKIQCECGTRFAFDVEPVNGRMPVRINCPECGADATDLANEDLREKLGAVAAPVPAPVAILPTPPPAAQPPPVPGRQPLRVTAPKPAPDAPLFIPPTPPPAPQPMRVAVPQPAPVTDGAAATSVTYCPRHLKNPAVETCRVCGKPICEECMQTYGYACSTFCRKRAEETGVKLPVYGKQRAVIEARVTRMVSLIIKAAVLLGVIFVGA
jgi:hypothetical protein